MKKKTMAFLAGICAAALCLTGCQTEISNDYVTISQYKGVEVEKQESEQVTDEQVEEQIELVRQSYATTSEVTDRAAQDGDIVTIDYEGKKDDVAFEGGTAEGAQLMLGSDSFIDGFEDGIIGHNIGETFDLNLTFPETYQAEELAGQDVVFTVTLQAITEQNIPDLDDEFVKSVSETSATVEEYKQEVKESLQSDNDASAQETLTSAAWDVVLDNTAVTKYPKEDLQDMISMIKGQYEDMAEYYGMEFADFLSYYMGMDEDTFNTEVTKAAKEQLKEELAAKLISDKAKVDVSDEALEAKYAEYAETYGYDSVDAMKEQIEAAGNMDSMTRMAKIDLVKDWVAANCKQVESTKDDTAEDSAE